MIRRTRLWLASVIALALFAAQLGMTAHASTHLGADPDKGLSQICDDCIASSSLQDMANDAAALPIVVQVAQQCPQKPAEKKQPRKRAFTGFKSRAPPALL